MTETNTKGKNVRLEPLTLYASFPILLPMIPAAVAEVNRAGITLENATVFLKYWAVDHIHRDKSEDNKASLIIFDELGAQWRRFNLDSMREEPPVIFELKLYSHDISVNKPTLLTNAIMNARAGKIDPSGDAVAVYGPAVLRHLHAAVALPYWERQQIVGEACRDKDIIAAHYGRTGVTSADAGGQHHRCRFHVPFPIPRESIVNVYRSESPMMLPEDDHLAWV